MTVNIHNPGSPGPSMNWMGHVMVFFRPPMEDACARCDRCGLTVSAADALEGGINVDPCAETEQGRRLIAEAQAQAPVITEPCLAVPEGWEGTDAEAIALAVAGAVADIGRQRDQAAATLERALDLISSLVAAFPETSWAGSNIAKDQAVEFLQQHRTTPDAGQ